LMAQTDQHLGFQPRTCALDAAFDAFYGNSAKLTL
jgi:hypothetical protein